MKLNLNDSEIMEIMNLIANALNEDLLYDMEKATVRNVLKKVNNSVQYPHHNAIDDSVCTIVRDYYSESEKLTEDEYYLANLGNTIFKSYEKYLERK